MSLEIEKEVNEELKNEVYSLQFLNDYLSIKLTSDVVRDLKVTGLFGVIDALLYLGLKPKEIARFYNFGHLEPYNDPESFTEGVLNIIWGMPKEEIRNRYGRYLNDNTIEKLPAFNKNIQMLTSFCYEDDDKYMFIPNEKDLITRFSRYYNRKRSRDIFHFVIDSDCKFQRIDGRLFRALRFLVLQGYDFPDIDKIMDEQVEEIELKHQSSDDKIILNKEFVRKISNIIFEIMIVLDKYDCKIVNAKDLFNLKNNKIIIMDSKGRTTELDPNYLDMNINNYKTVIFLKSCDIEILDINSLFDKRIENLKFKYSREKNCYINIKRSFLESITNEIVNVMIKTYNFGFSISNIDDLFDEGNKLLFINDREGNKYSVQKDKMVDMLNIISECREKKFSVNYSQLFDRDKDIVEVKDKNGLIANIKRDKIIKLISVIELLNNNGYRFNDYSSLSDESQKFINVSDEENQIRFINKKQIYLIDRINNLSYEEKTKLIGKEKEILYMLYSENMRKKLFEWLPYTAKRWIPSAAIIIKIPANKSDEYFYNNNHVRFKKLLDLYNPRIIEEAEGIVSLGYMLGLFARKSSVSEKALKYIIENFLNKGIKADELHTTYGAVDLRNDFNEKFAEFFMFNYSKDKDAFMNKELRVNMILEMFARFDEIVELRPEKKIKTNTRRKLLTPEDAIKAITTFKSVEILGKKKDDERYVQLVDLLYRFGASDAEIKWSIALYDEALEIDEQSVKIPHIEDLSTSPMQFNSHLKSSPFAFISGRKTNCCSKYLGLAEDRLKHVITDPNWRYVTFTSSNNTYFDGLVWYDEEEKVVCIDNVEGQFNGKDCENSEHIPMMADTIIRYADGIYYKMKELGIPCNKVNVGKDSGTKSWSIFYYAWKHGLIVEDESPCYYPERNYISTDAHQQFTITDSNTLVLRRK